MMEVHSDAETLAGAAARRVAALMLESVHAYGRCTVALSGGSTPERMYELLASEPLCGAIPWDRIHVFWGDERCVPPDDERSNERMARRAMLEHVPIDEDNIHPIRCADDPFDAAADYEALLRRMIDEEHRQLDIALLGMGDDGHTAALFPDSPALDETVRWTAVVRKPGESIDRVTTTFPFLDTARQAIVLVSGASKAQALQAVRAGANLPAARLLASAMWMVDMAAAAGTSQSSQS